LTSRATESTKPTVGAFSLTDKKGTLDPLSEASLLGQLEPEQAMLSQIIATLNERFGTEFTEEDRVFFAEMKNRLSNHESLVESARLNSRDNVQLLFDMLFLDVLQGLIEGNFDTFKRINDNPAFAGSVRDLLFEVVYPELEQP
jgi:type I restriction enzyme, R subunit